MCQLAEQRPGNRSHRKLGRGNEIRVPGVVSQGEIVGDAQVFGALHHRQQVYVLIHIPRVFRPMNVRVAADPPARLHVQEPAGGQRKVVGLPGGKHQIGRNQRMFKAALERDSGLAGGQQQIKPPVAVKEGQGVAGTPAGKDKVQKRLG